MRQRVARLTARLALDVIDLLAENPFCTATRMATRLDVAFTTAQRAIDRLESAGVLIRVSEAKRNRVYCAKQILEILEEPA